MIVVDTHVWIWWKSDPSRLSIRARNALESESEIGVCAVSCWELAMLVRKGRLRLDRDVLVWIKLALARPRLKLIPLSAEVAVLAAAIGGEQLGDPADAIIVASTMATRARLVTKDRGIRSLKKVPTVW